MAKKFGVSNSRKQHINKKYKKKDRVTDLAIKEMERVMLSAIDYMVEHYTATGCVVSPSLNGMEQVGEHFYRSVIQSAYDSAHEEKHLKENKMTRLAAPGPVGLPKKIKTVADVFHNQKYWQRILKRNKKLSARLRKQYMDKLKRAFKELIPAIDKNEITPAEVKKQLTKEWDTSKSRVETIFRTESTNYFSKTQVAFFDGDEDIIGFLFDSVRDRVETNWCSSRHGLVYRPGTKLLTDNTPACHWNCRSHLIALANTSMNRKMLEDKDRDPSRVKVVPLPNGWRK